MELTTCSLGLAEYAVGEATTAFITYKIWKKIMTSTPNKPHIKCIDPGFVLAKEPPLSSIPLANANSALENFDPPEVVNNPPLLPTPVGQILHRSQNGALQAGSSPSRCKLGLFNAYSAFALLHEDQTDDQNEDQVPTTEPVRSQLSSAVHWFSPAPEAPYLGQPTLPPCTAMEKIWLFLLHPLSVD
ncbi:hypothetical protein NE237_023891 [Protea cynaroides]|uniref:Uncharacterized protein n=1 Tax=Protea cynaroides TaxID=273540 RepID=A0A9Q0HCL5_9MAGN|nr:hypothetical protein NE237_023891 [Protea cynaroides]